MDPHVSKNGISRRRMLKRIGAGAAVAWSAPVLSSLRTPAFAQYPPRCSGQDFQCGGAVTFCGQGDIPGAECFCDLDVEGTSRCFDRLCEGNCTTNADCGPNRYCVPTTCCISVCIAVCGEINPRTHRAGRDPLGLA